MSRPHVALLGLGAMGRRMAQRLQAAGFPLTTWSRSGLPSECSELEASFQRERRKAVEPAEVVVSMVRDDVASRELWLDPAHGALPALPKDTLVLECSTLTPDWVISLGRAVSAAGSDFLDAPVLGSRPQAEAGQLIFLVGGEGTSLSRAQPIFEVCGSARFALCTPGAGARLKRFANALFAIQVAALAELLPTLASDEAKPEDRTALLTPETRDALERLPVLSPAALGALRGMLAGASEPGLFRAAQFPIELVTKDLGYATEQGTALPITSRALEVFLAANNAGLGGLNLTAILQRYTPPSSSASD